MINTLRFLKINNLKTQFILNLFYFRSKPVRIAVQFKSMVNCQSICMKKKLLPILFLTLFTFNSFSQIGVGLRAGFGGSSTSQEIVTGMTRTLGTGPNFGLMLNYDFDLHFSAGLELNYVNYMEKLSYSEKFHTHDPFQTPVTTSYSINYLQIPIFGRVTIGEKKYKATLTFGPYIGIGLNGKWENSPRSRNRNSNISLDTNVTAAFKTGDFNRLDFGGLIGLGGQYQVAKSGIIFIEARFQLGFSNFFNNFNSNVKQGFTGSQYQTPGASWRSANITLGYLHTFKIPKKSSGAAVKKAGKQR